MTKTCNRAYESLVHAVVVAQLRPRSITLTPIPTVQDTIVYRVTTDVGHFIFKTMDPTGRDADGLALEAQVCTMVAAVGVPVPPIVVLDTSTRAFPGAYVLMEQARGHPLSTLTLTAADQRTVYEQLGAALRRLHAIHLPGFGWLDEATYHQAGAIRGQAATWEAALYAAVPDAIAYLASHTDLTTHEVATLERLVAELRPSIAPYADGRVLHGDLGRLHVWVEPATCELTAIIDWGNRMAGDPLWDFVDYEWDDLPVLWAAYEPRAATVPLLGPRFSGYAVLRAIPWAAKWHARGGTHVLTWRRHTLRHATAAAALLTAAERRSQPCVICCRTLRAPSNRPRNDGCTALLRCWVDRYRRRRAQGVCARGTATVASVSAVCPAASPTATVARRAGGRSHGTLTPGLHWAPWSGAQPGGPRRVRPHHAPRTGKERRCPPSRKSYP